MWARLTARDGERYDLTGPRLTELTDVGYNDLRVTGTLVAQNGAQRWQLAMSDWEIASPQPPQCLVGVFVRDEGGAWVEIDKDAISPVASDLVEPGRYRLPGAPDELEDGERIEVCANAWPATGDVEWRSITTPPTSEQTPSGGAAISTSVVVEQAVEEAPTASAPDAHAPTAHPRRAGGRDAAHDRRPVQRHRGRAWATWTPPTPSCSLSPQPSSPGPPPPPADPPRGASLRDRPTGGDHRRGLRHHLRGW